MVKKCNKIKHKTHENAEKHLEAIKKSKHNVKGVGSIYYCNKCSAYHTTRMTKNQYKDLIKFQNKINMLKEAEYWSEKLGVEFHNI